MIEKLIITLPQEENDEAGSFDGNQDDPEEKVCPKCLELESECQCPYFDQIEAEELKAIDTARKPSDIFKILGDTQIMFNNL